jgi:hypothetical protein
MARVRSTACLRDDGTVAEGEGGDSGGSLERTLSVQTSDAGLLNQAGDDCDKGSRTRSYYFGPLTVTVNHIREMIDLEYFAEGVAHALGEETILEPHGDEAVVFEELVPASLRMPPHPVLSNIRLKFQVQLH